MSHIDGARVRPLPTPMLAAFGLAWIALGVTMALMASGAFAAVDPSRLPGWVVAWVGYSLVFFFGFVRPHIVVTEGGVVYRGRNVETFLPYSTIAEVDARSPRAVVLRLVDGGQVRAVIAGAPSRAVSVADAVRGRLSGGEPADDDAIDERPERRRIFDGAAGVAGVVLTFAGIVLVQLTRT